MVCIGRNIVLVVLGNELRGDDGAGILFGNLIKEHTSLTVINGGNAPENITGLIGVTAIYSSSQHLPGDYHFKQMFWILVSLIALFVFLSIDYNSLVTYSFPFYLICLVILLGILFFGVFISGAKSWIRLPFFQIQPSEICKITVILLLAQVFSSFKKTYLTWSRYRSAYCPCRASARFRDRFELCADFFWGFNTGRS